jgi:hypothetical protein
MAGLQVTQSGSMAALDVAVVVVQTLETWAVEEQEEAHTDLRAKQPRHSVPGDC